MFDRESSDKGFQLSVGAEGRKDAEGKKRICFSTLMLELVQLQKGF